MTAHVLRPDLHRAPAHAGSSDTEARLRASEESYRTIFELASDAIFVHDIETGAILDANRGACEMHGCTLDELKALGVGGISDGRPPFDAAHAQAYVRQAVEGEPQRFEWLVRRKTGERFWVEVDLHRVRILGADRVLASVRNIDERKRAEAVRLEAHEELERRVAERTHALALAEARLRAIVEASPTPLVVSRIRDGAVLYASGRAEALVAVGPGALEGATTVDFYADPADREALVTDVIREGGVRDRELEIRRADGSLRWVSATVLPFTFGGEPALVASLLDVTERRATEAALRDRTNQLADRTRELEAVFRALPDLYFRMEADGTIRDYRAGRQFGLYVPPQEFLGRRVADVLPDPVGGQTTAALAEVAATGQPVYFEYTLPLGDERRDFEARLLPLDDGGGEVVAVVRDVTARTRAEEALRASEEHFRRLIENATDLISIVAADGSVRYQSPSVERVLGYSPGTFEEGGAFDHIHPDDEPGVRAALSAALAAPGTPHAITFRFRHADGTWRVLEATGQTLSPTSGDEGVVVNSRDVTERVEAERAVRYQWALLEAEGEASIDGILVVGEDGRVLTHNSRFADLWGLSRASLAGFDVATFDAVLDQVADPAAFRASVDHLYLHPDEEARASVVLRDGRVFDRYTAPVRGRAGEHYGRIWFFRDVTVEQRRADELDAARRQAEAALSDLQRAQDRLVQQEKMAALGRLAAGVAHEIKNPLNFVTNFASLSRDAVEHLEAALASGGSPQGVAELLGDLRANAEAIEAHGHRADAIVRSMLDHVGGPPGGRRQVDVNELVEAHLSAALDRHAGPAVQIDRSYAPDVGDAVVAEREMGRAVANLVSNALEAVSDRAARGETGYTPQVAVATWREGDVVTVRIADNGMGMEPEVARQAMEPFFTTKPAGEGTGLGLSLAHDVVVQGHGGDLTLETVEGQGTAFTLTIPGAPGPAVEGSARARRARGGRAVQLSTPTRPRGTSSGPG